MKREERERLVTSKNGFSSQHVYLSRISLSLFFLPSLVKEGVLRQLQQMHRHKQSVVRMKGGKSTGDCNWRISFHEVEWKREKREEGTVLQYSHSITKKKVIGSRHRNCIISRNSRREAQANSWLEKRIQYTQGKLYSDSHHHHHQFLTENIFFVSPCDVLHSSLSLDLSPQQVKVLDMGSWITSGPRMRKKQLTPWTVWGFKIKR